MSSIQHCARHIFLDFSVHGLFSPFLWLWVFLYSSWLTPDLMAILNLNCQSVCKWTMGPNTCSLRACSLSSSLCGSIFSPDQEGIKLLDVLHGPLITVSVPHGVPTPVRTLRVSKSLQGPWSCNYEPLLILYGSFFYEYIELKNGTLSDSI